jgi:hypothetical protein
MALGMLPTIKADSDIKDSETATSILGLPSELLIEILRHVDGRSILRCSCVRMPYCPFVVVLKNCLISRSAAN